jgi:hypothetical protein
MTAKYDKRPSSGDYKIWPDDFITPEQGQERPPATSSGGQVEIDKPENFSRILWSLIGTHRNANPHNTEFMIRLLSRDDLRGRTAQMWAKEKSFGMWLTDFIQSSLEDEPVLSTKRLVLRDFYQGVDWNFVARTLRKRTP